MGEPCGRRRDPSDQVNEQVVDHLPMVRHIVMQLALHYPRHVDREDLARAGALGLVEAARRYDASQRVPFHHFAAQRIRGAVLDAARAADWAPRSVRSLSRHLDLIEHDLMLRLGRLPTAAELSDGMGLSTAELARLNERIARSAVLALDALVDAAEDGLDADVFRGPSGAEPVEVLEARELLAYLRDALSLLPERLQLVVVGTFLEGRTSLEIADLLGVSPSRVSQLRGQALDMLRSGILAQYHAGPTPAVPAGASVRRQAVYAAAIGSATSWRDRLAPRSSLPVAS